MNSSRKPFEEGEEPFIVYQDDRFLAAFKPVGMHSAPAGSRGEKEAACLSTWLKEEINASKVDVPSIDRLWLEAEFEFGMLNRLDEVTSGLVLFAKNQVAFSSYRSLQRMNRIEKTYLALATKSGVGLRGSSPTLNREVFSAMTNEFGKLERPIKIESVFAAYGPRGGSVRCFNAKNPPARKALHLSSVYASEIRSISAIKLPCEAQGDGSASHRSALSDRTEALAIVIMIHAGFRHQIRAHLAWAGFPILGDERYGGEPARRLFLEARQIRFAMDDGYRFEVLL